MDGVCMTQLRITATEVKVLSMMRQGMTNREIAQGLFRSEYTIKTHVENILAKTGARNRAQVCAMVLPAASTGQQK